MSTGHQTRTRLALVVAGTAVALLAAACGGSSSGATGTSGTSAAAAGQGASTGAVHTAKGTLGTILVDGRGMTIYQFAPDKPGRSTCYGSCATYWPPVMAPATLPASVPGVTGKLGTTTRKDGSSQLTVAGHPLYTYVGDSAPGQTKGQNLDDSGGLWTVLSAAGAPVTAGPAAAGGGY